MSKIPASPGTVRNKIARGNCINLWTVASGALFSIAQDNDFYGKMGMSDYYALYQTMRDRSDCYLSKEACDNGYAYMPPLLFDGDENINAMVTQLVESLPASSGIGMRVPGSASGPTMFDIDSADASPVKWLDNYTIKQVWQKFGGSYLNYPWQFLMFRHTTSSPLPFVTSVIFYGSGSGADTVLSSIEDVRFVWANLPVAGPKIIAVPDDPAITCMGWRLISPGSLNSRGYMKAGALNLVSHSADYYPHTEEDLNNAIESYSNGIFEE